MGKIILGVILILVAAVFLSHVDVYRSMHPYMAKSEVMNELVVESISAGVFGVIGAMLIIFGFKGR